MKKRPTRLDALACHQAFERKTAELKSLSGKSSPTDAADGSANTRADPLPSAPISQECV